MARSFLGLLIAAVGAAAAPGADRYGDPLPAGALLRVGTARFQHGATVTGLAFSPDGKSLAAVAGDGLLRLWDAADGKERWRAADTWVGAVAFAPDGRQVATGNGVGVIRLWDAETGREVGRLEGHQGRVHALAFAPGGGVLASASADRTVRLWDVTTGRETRRLVGHAGEIRAVAFAPDGRSLATGGDGVRLWDPATGRPLTQLSGTAPTVGLAFAPDGRTLASAGEGRAVRLWDLEEGLETRQLEGATGATAEVVVWSADGKAVIASGPDGAPRAWDVATGKARYTVKGRTEGGGALAIHGQTVAVAGPGHTIDLWDAGTGKRRPSPAGRLAVCTAAAWSADGKWLAAGGADGSARVSDAATGESVRHWTGLATPAFLAVGGGIVAAGPPVRLWDVATGAVRREPGATGAAPDTCLALTPDGRRLAVGRADGGITVYSPALAAEGRRLRVPTAVTALAFAPDGRTLAAATADNTLHVWDVGTGTLLRRWDAVPAGTALAVGPGGQVASGDADGMISLWAADSGKEVRQLAGHAGTVNALAFAPDGHTLASAGADPVVRLWELASGQAVAEFVGHAGAVRAVAFAPDGRRLLSGGDDATLLVWDVAGRFQVGPPGRLSSRDLDELWKQLAGVDGPRGYRAVATLAAAPDQAVPMIRDRLRGLLGIDARRLARLIEQLDANTFAEREQATAELTRVVRWAEPALRRALANPPSLEARRRIERILGSLHDQLPARLEQLRLLRALHALEKAGTPEARRVLQGVAEGADGEVRQAARAALARLPDTVQRP